MKSHMFSFGLRELVMTTALGLGCMALATAPVQAAKGLPARYQDIRFPELIFVAPHPDSHKVNLDGGAVAYLVPDSTLDLIKVTVYSGESNQPQKPGEVAALRMYSSLLKAGGAGSLSPEKLEDSLEFVAAYMNAGLEDWQGTASLDCLTGNAPELLKLLPDLVLKPRLDTAVFRVNQRNLIENLRHRYDTPRGVMGVLYERVMQGSHPSNWLPAEAEVATLQPKSLASLSGRGFPADRLVFAVAGRFDRTEMVKRLNGMVKRFASGSASVATVPASSTKATLSLGTDARPFKGPMAPGVYIVDKPFAQATIQIAAPGVKRPDPDYYRLSVASYIFGDGGFTSRLVEKVRSNEGLAYGVSSDIESDYYRRGSVSVSLQTKVETGAYAIRLVLDEMKRMREGGITEAELVKAKDGLLKSMPSLFDSPGATARIFAQGEIWRRKPDHFIEYEKSIKALTKAEVEDAFKRYFLPDSMRIVVVGPKAGLMAKDARGLSLTDFGKVTDITTAELDKRD
jgi:zinc protease